jgi:hypothetical protein
MSDIVLERLIYTSDRERLKARQQIILAASPPGKMTLTADAGIAENLRRDLGAILQRPPLYPCKAAQATRISDWKEGYSEICIADNINMRPDPRKDHKDSRQRSTPLPYRQCLSSRRSGTSGALFQPLDPNRLPIRIK